MTATATYRRLPNGTWGAKVNGPVDPGQRIRIERKDGQVAEQTVAAVLMRQDDGSCIVSLEDAKRVRRGYERRQETGERKRSGATCPHCGGTL